MSETKRLEASKQVTGHACGTEVGGATVFNGNPYPVEVTVRRVVEKVVYHSAADYTPSDFVTMVKEDRKTADLLRKAGYAQGDRFRVTIEPLD